MRRSLQKILMTLTLLGIVASCSTTNDVANNRGIQKRKYTKGYFIDFNHNKGGNSQDNVAKNNGTPVIETTIAVEESLVRNLEKEIVYVEENNTVAIEPTQMAVETKVETPKTTQAAVELVTENHDINKVEVEEIESIQSHSKFMRKDLKAAKRNSTSLNSESSDDAILYYILAILIPFLAVGLVTNWDLVKVIICLLLCIFFWLPGMIYALIVVHNNV